MSSDTFAWHENAACRKLQPEFAGADFYPETRRSAGAKLAKQICGICPTRTKCLDWALKNEERFGIWAGTDPKERQWLLNPVIGARERRDASTR